MALWPNPASAQLLVNKSFTPVNTVVGQTTILTIEILNNTTTLATNVTLTDNLPTSPTGLTVAVTGALSNSCGGTVTAVAGTTTVSLAGGTIAAATPAGVAGSCSFTVQAVGSPTSPPASFVNTIPAANVSSSIGGTGASASATLTVAPLAGITGSKAFADANVHGNGPGTRMTIQLNNSNAIALTGVAFTDSFPTQLQLASVPNATNGCGGTLTATGLATSLILSGGTIPAAGNCTISVDTVVRNPNTSSSNGTVTNSIAANGVTSTQGARNAAAISGSLTVQRGATVTKAFSPTSIVAGGTSTLTVTITNYNATAISSFNLTDTLPTNLTVSGGMSTSCGGTASSPTGASLVLTGGTLAAAPTAIGSTSCTLSATVTSAIAATYTNTITAGTIGGVNFAAATATLTVINGASVTKAFSPATVAAGGTSTLTVTLRNNGATALSGFALTDPLPSGLTATSASTSCGGSASFTATSLTVTGGSLAAGATCTLSGSVTPGAGGSFVNSIPAGNLSGVPYNAASATLTASSIAVSKTFTPTSAPRTGYASLVITLTNRSTASAATITSFSDLLTTMGTGITIAATSALTPAPSTTCVGSSLTAASGSTSIALSGGVIPIATSATVPGTCRITVPIQLSNTVTTGAKTNTIAVGDLVTSLGSNTVSGTQTFTVNTPLTVAKAFAPSTVGTNGITRLTVTLTRPARAALYTSVAVTDTLPTGFTVAPTPNALTSCTSGTVTAVAGSSSVSLSGASLGTSQSASASCTYSADITAPGTVGTSTNTIAVGGATASSALGAVSNTGAATANIIVVDGVLLNKDFAPLSILPGGTSRLTISIQNNKPTAIALTSVALTDALPTGMTLKSPPNATFSCSGTVSATGGGNTFGITGGSISAGATCTLAADVTTGSVGSMTNTLTPGLMTSSQGVTNVNTASATLVGSGSTDISITKDDGVTQLSAGETIAYTLIITNTSSVNGAAGLPVADTPPADISITGWTCSASSGSSCASATGGAGPLATTVTLLPSGQATIAVAALVDQASSATSLTNTATINPAAASITDTNSSNNSASDTDTIVRRADIAIAKTVSDPNPKVGNTIDFTITATNNGPSKATAVTVTDSLPAGYTLASATPDIGSYAAPIWTVGDLDSGDVATLTVVVTVNPTGPYANTASGATSTTDPVSSNNSATITPSTVNLTIVKSSQLISDPINGTTNPKVIPGAIIDYTLTISNSGTAPIDANTIVIEDNLPPETMPYVSTATGPPIIFANGTTASGLNYSYAANTSWSNQSGGGPPYTYPPSPDTSGYDPAATAFRISPTGTMVAGTASTPSSFTLTYRVKVR